MGQTNLLANPVTNSSDKVVSIASWDNNIESHLITKIYKSTEEVALWFPEFFSSSAESEAITIYQIIVWIKETLEILE